ERGRRAAVADFSTSRNPDGGGRTTGWGWDRRERRMLGVRPISVLARQHELGKEQEGLARRAWLEGLQRLARLSCIGGGDRPGPLERPRLPDHSDDLLARDGPEVAVVEHRLDEGPLGRVALLEAVDETQGQLSLLPDEAHWLSGHPPDAGAAARS